MMKSNIYYRIFNMLYRFRVGEKFKPYKKQFDRSVNAVYPCMILTLLFWAILIIIYLTIVLVIKKNMMDFNFFLRIDFLLSLTFFIFHFYYFIITKRFEIIDDFYHQRDLSRKEKVSLMIIIWGLLILAFYLSIQLKLMKLI